MRLEEERGARLGEAEGRKAAESGGQEARAAAAEERERWEAERASAQVGVVSVSLNPHPRSIMPTGWV